MQTVESASPISAANAARSKLDRGIAAATRALTREQRRDGHWVFELEADATLPAEYVLLRHFLGDPDAALEAKIGVYLRRIRGKHGGWALYYDGPFNLSASVKAYFALKVIGDSPDAPHMRAARQAILAHGGAPATNVFTRILLALFGQMSWHAVPVIPVEIVFFPRWFPFHLSRISYWGRTVLVPLLVLQALKPLAKNPRGIRIDELFIGAPPKRSRQMRAPHQSRAWFTLFIALDTLLRVIEPYSPKRLRQRAMDKAIGFVRARLNGEGGLGAIFPAMANTVMMFDALGYARDHPDLVTARHAIDKLLVIRPDEAYCQPCVSPVWDTALACHALFEVGDDKAFDRACQGLAWLKPRQVLDVAGDWVDQRPHVRPGGWAFQYANAYYPDLDDTAVVVMAMDRAERDIRASAEPSYREAIERAREWVRGMQSRNHGWGAFDADNTSHYLNHIPFADHGALLDPPTADVTARCVGMLAQCGEDTDRAMIATAMEFLRREQRADGSWYGRWGMNYIYGTWSVLCAFAAVGGAGSGERFPEVSRAVQWLTTIQNRDGGWGESGVSYELDYRGYQSAPSTASQTAWAILGLLAAGESRHPAVARGIDYLLSTQSADGFWPEPQYTATGFPRVFYLRYHGYSKFFPLWALARYRNVRNGVGRGVRLGM